MVEVWPRTRVLVTTCPGWPESRVGRRAVTLAGLSVGGVVLLVLSFTLGVVEPPESYTDSWGQLVWGLGIWACGIGAVVTGLVAILRHHGAARDERVTADQLEPRFCQL